MTSFVEELEHDIDEATLVKFSLALQTKSIPQSFIYPIKINTQFRKYIIPQLSIFLLLSNKECIEKGILKPSVFLLLKQT